MPNWTELTRKPDQILLGSRWLMIRRPHWWSKKRNAFLTKKIEKSNKKNFFKFCFLVASSSSSPIYKKKLQEIFSRYQNNIKNITKEWSPFLRNGVVLLTLWQSYNTPPSSSCECKKKRFLFSVENLWKKAIKDKVTLHEKKLPPNNLSRSGNVLKICSWF